VSEAQNIFQSACTACCGSNRQRDNGGGTESVPPLHTNHDNKGHFYLQRNGKYNLSVTSFDPLTYGCDHLLATPWVRAYPMSTIKPAFWKDAVPV